MKKEFATPEAAAMLAVIDHDRPADHRLEEFLPAPGMMRGDEPVSDEKVYCTTEEREEFEEANQIALTADVIDDYRDYDALVRWLTENYNLAEV